MENIGIEPLAGEEPSAYAVENIGIEPLAGEEPSIYAAENTGDYDVTDIGPSLGPEFAFAPILRSLIPNFGRESQSILAEGVGFGNEQAFVRWKGAGTGAAAYAEADVTATASPWTVEGWLRAADVGAWGVAQSSITGSLIQLKTATVIKYEISLNAGKIRITNPAGATVETLAAFDDGDMHHVRLVFNGTTLACLVDGIPELMLGATDITWDRVRLANSLAADLREWRIKTEALTTSIFNPVWDYTSDGTTFALWHIDEGTGVTLNDSSPNNRHLTIAGVDYRWIDWDFALRVTLNGATQGLVSGDVRARQAFWTVAVGAVSGPVVVEHISVHADESAALAFTVLPPVPLRGVGFEVRIYDRLNYASLLTILENAYGVAFSTELDAAGAGQFKLSLNDAKAIDTNLAHGNLARIYLDGVERFAFFIENTQENLVVGDDVSGREVTISGSGLLNALDHMLVYPPSWPAANPSKWTFTDATPGTILAAFLDAGVGRGVLPDLTYDFTAVVDSLGVAWPTLFTTEYEAGISVLMIIEQFVALGYDVKMDSDFSLHFFVTSGLDRSTGQAPTVFSEGDNLVVQKRNAVSSDVKNVALIKRQTSIFEAGVTSDFPRREMMVDARQTDDPTTAQFLATRTLEGVRQTDDAFTGEVTSLEGHAEVFVDWDLGDTVIVDVPDFIDRQAFRIRALTCEQTGRDYIRFTVSFNSVRHEFVARLKHLLDQLTGGGLIGNMGLGAGSPTILLGTIGGGAGAPLVVQEDDVTKVSAAAIMDFLSADFDVTEAPSGEANIIIAAALMRDAEHAALGDGAPHHVAFVQADADALYEPIGSVAVHEGLVDAHPVYMTPIEHAAIGDGAPHHIKYTDAEAITAVEGEATLNLGGAVAVTGVLTLTDLLAISKEGIEDKDGVLRLSTTNGFPFYANTAIRLMGAVSGNTVIIEDGDLRMDDGDVNIQGNNLRSTNVNLFESTPFGVQGFRVQPRSGNFGAALEAVPSGTSTLATFNMYNDSAAAVANRVRFGIGLLGLGIELAAGMRCDMSILEALPQNIFHFDKDDGYFSVPLLIGAEAAPEAGYALELRDDFLLGAFYQELREMSAPSAPAANGLRVYTSDVDGDSRITVLDENLAEYALTSGIIHRDNSVVPVSNTITETTLFSAVIPANIIGATGILHYVVYGNYKNNSGATRSLQIKVKLGATTVLDNTMTAIAVDADTTSFRLEGYLANRTTSDQRIDGMFTMGQAGGPTVGQGSWTNAPEKHGLLFSGAASAEDTTGALTFEVTATHGNANANLTISKQAAFIEKIC